MTIKDAVLAIGKNGRLLTNDGWICDVEITDAPVAYGQVRVGVAQDLSQVSHLRPPRLTIFVDASRVEII